MVISVEELRGRIYNVHGMNVSYVSGYTSWVKPCKFSCSIHGEFTSIPKGVFEKRNSCKGCKLKKMSSKSSFKKGNLVWGVGVRDLDINLFSDINRYKKIYNSWSNMIERCYSNSGKFPAYEGCAVSENWLHCSKFFSDIVEMDNYEMLHKGWHLDKDVILKGNKVYSKDTCCIVPNEINSMFNRAAKHRGDLPIGVCFDRSKCKFLATMQVDGKSIFLGYFSNIEDAFIKYKVSKESVIRDKANKLRPLIGERVYNAMLQYKVEITD